MDFTGRDSAPLAEGSASHPLIPVQRTQRHSRGLNAPSRRRSCAMLTGIASHWKYILEFLIFLKLAELSRSRICLMTHPTQLWIHYGALRALICSMSYHRVPTYIFELVWEPSSYYKLYAITRAPSLASFCFKFTIVNLILPAPRRIYVTMMVDYNETSHRYPLHSWTSLTIHAVDYSMCLGRTLYRNPLSWIRHVSWFRSFQQYRACIASALLQTKKVPAS